MSTFRRFAGLMIVATIAALAGIFVLNRPHEAASGESTAPPSATPEAPGRSIQYASHVATPSATPAPKSPGDALSAVEARLGDDVIDAASFTVPPALASTDSSAIWLSLRVKASAIGASA